MDEPGDGFSYCSHAPEFNTVVEVLSNACNLQRVAVTAEDVHVVPGPPLDEGGKECGRKTAHEAHEPVGIHPDVRRRWVGSISRKG